MKRVLPGPFDPDKVLTHYTRSVDAVLNILQHGLAWAPNGRKLKDLFPSELVVPKILGGEEPEQNGMISLTEHPPPGFWGHRLIFGRFGIVLDRTWAESQRARPVWYVRRGSREFKDLQARAAAAFEDLKAKTLHPEDGMWQLGYGYAPAAAAINGAMEWANFLVLYRYLEPAENEYQWEWRIIHPTGAGSLSRDRKKLIEDVSPPQGWAAYINVLKIPEDKVVGFVCPWRRRRNFLSQLPAQYRDRQIWQHWGL